MDAEELGPEPEPEPELQVPGAARRPATPQTAASEGGAATAPLATQNAAMKTELARLRKCGVRALRAEARALGLGEEVLTAAVEGETPREDLIKLLLKHGKWPEPEA
eukprot:COSAG04_NODE_10718_length_757_cov_1.142857_1_plen_106_part_10